MWKRWPKSPLTLIEKGVMPSDRLKAKPYFGLPISVIIEVDVSPLSNALFLNAGYTSLNSCTSYPVQRDMVRRER